MKSLRFDDLWVLSEKTGKARHLKWARNRNLLIGGNQTGKSTALRMIFHAFGCKINPVGKEWDRGATVAVRFSLDDAQQVILRRDDMFALFGTDGTLIWATQDSGNLRDRFSLLFNFVLLLTSHGEPKLARPAFFFVPTFIDQDGSWLLKWDTFQSLAEFQGWQKPTIELAMGIRTSEYWRARSDLNSKKSKAEEIKKEQMIFANARKGLERKFPRIPWFTDGIRFRRELKELESQAGSLAVQQSSVRDECAEAAAARDMLGAQVQLIDRALAAHAADMRFLDTRRIGEDIVCPTCGTAHEHSFYERLNLEAEADELRQMRTRLAAQAERSEKRLQAHEEQLSDIQHRSDAIEDLLSRERGKLKLREIIDRAGVSMAYEALEEEAKATDQRLIEIAREIRDIEDRLRHLEDRQKAASITEKFNGLYSRFVNDLDVPPSHRTRKGPVHLRPLLGGSGGPRTVLAYYFAISHVAAEFSEGYVPPLLIDSPHANAQDDINRPRVTEFILNNSVPGQQLILGLEEAPPNSVQLQAQVDKRIDLKEKYGLLQRNEYPEVLAFLEPLVQAAVRHRGNSLF
jgi:uncharacterized Zn finger protein (UPF0148 family)